MGNVKAAFRFRIADLGLRNACPERSRSADFGFEPPWIVTKTKDPFVQFVENTPVFVPGLAPRVRRDYAETSCVLWVLCGE